MYPHRNAKPSPKGNRNLQHLYILGARPRLVQAGRRPLLLGEKDHSLQTAALSSKSMRIIAGEFRSRRLVAPAGFATRPTSDRLRETLFNVLEPRIVGARFLDLYAGSGAVGLEALSRGASFCCFVERAPAALAALRANSTALRLASGISVQATPVARFLAKPGACSQPPFELVFLDPPYEAAAEYTGTLSALGGSAHALLTPGALVLAEHSRKTPLSLAFGSLTRFRLLEQGDAALSFYSTAPAPPTVATPGA